MTSVGMLELLSIYTSPHTRIIVNSKADFAASHPAIRKLCIKSEPADRVLTPDA